MKSRLFIFTALLMAAALLVFGCQDSLTGSGSSTSTKDALFAKASMDLPYGGFDTSNEDATVLACYCPQEAPEEGEEGEDEDYEGPEGWFEGVWLDQSLMPAGECYGEFLPEENYFEGEWEIYDDEEWDGDQQWGDDQDCEDDEDEDFDEDRQWEDGEEEVLEFGFIEGEWKDNRFFGKWFNEVDDDDEEGLELGGYIFGIYGKNAEGEGIFYGKYVDANGNFLGLLFGQWGLDDEGEDCEDDEEEWNDDQDQQWEDDQQFDEEEDDDHEEDEDDK